MPTESAVSNISKNVAGHGAPLFVIRTGAAGQPTLQVTTTSNYNWLYSDSGSGASMDVTIRRPQPSDPTFFIIGDYAQGDYSSPVGNSFIVRAINDDPKQPLLARPTSYREVWNDHGSGGHNDGSIWFPVPPDGYITLGFVGQSGYNAPSIDNYRCVRRDLAVPSEPGGLIWSDKNSGAHQDVSLYSIVDFPNAFVAQGSYSPFNGTAYKLKTL